MKESKEQVEGDTLFKCSLGDCHGCVISDNSVKHESLRQRVRDLFEEGLRDEIMVLEILDSRIRDPNWLNSKNRHEFARKVIQDAVNKIKLAIICI